MVMVAVACRASSTALFDRIAQGSVDAGTDRIIFSLGTMLGQTMITAISATVVGALYVELRTVKEGASTEAMAEVFA